MWREGLLRVDERPLIWQVRLVREGLLRERLARCGGESVDLATHFVVGALWSTVVCWMDAGARLPPRDVNSLFRRLASPGLERSPRED